MEHTDEHDEFDAEFRTWDKLHSALENSNDEDVAYVYRVDRLERPIRPYVAKYWLPATDLIWQLQSKLGGGVFRILIRSGRTMKFSGVVGVEALPRIVG